MRAANSLADLVALSVILILIAVVLTGCGETKYVPITVERSVAPLAAECKRDVPEDLPAVPPLAGNTADPARVNAHWAKSNIEQRRAYRSVRDDYRVCQRYAQGVAKK